MSATLKTITAAELLSLSPSMHCELIHGEVKPMSPAGAEHGWTVARLTVRLGHFVEEHHLGFVFGAETGFVLERNPDTVRAPDVSFVRADRIPSRPTRKFLAAAPDLAVEVISPGDTSSEVNAKAEQWLRCGSSMVWLVDPARDSASVCVLEDEGFVSRTVTHLSAPVLLPGFSLSVKSLFGV